MTQSSPLGESSEMSWVDSSIGAKPNSSINSLARAVAIVHSACVGCFLHAIVKESIVPSTRDDDPGLHRHAQAFIDLGLRRVKHQCRLTLSVSSIDSEQGAKPFKRRQSHSR